jgi:hypothetical protein
VSDSLSYSRLIPVFDESLKVSLFADRVAQSQQSIKVSLIPVSVEQWISLFE